MNLVLSNQTSSRLPTFKFYKLKLPRWDYLRYSR